MSIAVSYRPEPAVEETQPRWLARSLVPVDILTTRSTLRCFLKQPIRHGRNARLGFRRVARAPRFRDSLIVVLRKNPWQVERITLDAFHLQGRSMTTGPRPAPKEGRTRRSAAPVGSRGRRLRSSQFGLPSTFSTHLHCSTLALSAGVVDRVGEQDLTLFADEAVDAEILLIKRVVHVEGDRLVHAV